MNGGCHCGAVRYEITGEVLNHSLCHCSDCRRAAGAPMVGWAMFQETALSLTKGQTKIYHSSAHGRREFCAACGTGLFYRNAEILPGMVDVQTATLDQPDRLAPTCHIQTAEQIDWMRDAHALPKYERYPPPT